MVKQYNKNNLYDKAHLIVAVIRVWNFEKNTSPTLSDISGRIHASLEEVNLTCKKLQTVGVLDIVEDAFGARLFIKDHLKIEEIGHQVEEDPMEKAILSFQKRQQGLSDKVHKIQSEKKNRRRALFSDLEAKLKK